MRISKKAPAKQRAVVVSGLAAQVLGRSRASGGNAFTAREMIHEFPAFNVFELSHAISELVDRQLVTQSGQNDRAERIR